jgi:long-chain fatty acid transport protein
MHPLFPAIIRNHVTAGFGYALGKNAGIDFAFTHAPEVTVTNGPVATVSHRQNNWQLMFSYFY